MDKKRKSPVVLAVMDGVGIAPNNAGNAVARARTPFLGEVARSCPFLALEASGEAVGVLAGQMGNSEVGHNTLGAGQAFTQGILRVEQAFETGEIFGSEAWKTAVMRVLDGSNIDKNGNLWYNENLGLKKDNLEYAIRQARGEAVPKTLHFAGIFSDGGVHSHIEHLEMMIQKAYDQGVRRMRVHAVFDGRDVAPQSEPKYIRRFLEFVKQFADADIQIASGGGRMTTVADRYENDWGIVKRGFDMMVYGEAKYYFESAEEGVKELRAHRPDLQDQDLPAFVVIKDGKPVGKIMKGDSLIYFDFRADRAVEIATAFTAEHFEHFDRGDFKPSEVYFVGMTEYNTDTHIPEHRLVEMPKITDTLGQFLERRGVLQLAVSETVKFGHITYYFNGNSYEKADGEEFIEIPSDTQPFNTRPWMKSAEIADAVIQDMEKFDFIRLNFPGGDMVGHTADLEATTIAMEAIDLALKRIAQRVDELGGTLLITADHGNAEELLDESGEPKTSHTTNLVPFMIYGESGYKLAEIARPGLKNVAATVATILGFGDEIPRAWGESLVVG